MSAERKLPEDPGELEDALKMYRLIARPFVHGLSRTAAYLVDEPFDKAETDGGELAIGALLYQMGGQVDARIIALAWVGSVGMPRALKWLDKREKEKQARARGEQFRGDLQRVPPNGGTGTGT